MSSPLAIGAVSAVLRNLLDNGLVESGLPLGTIKVSAVAPDTIKLDDPLAPPSVNLFMHRVSYNAGWTNAAMPSRSSDGRRLTNAPLALDLHYLVTAYGTADFQAEILLGYAMHLLHERPVLDRTAIRRALDPSPLGASILPPAFQALVAADLADQVEAVKITPEPMDTEELSRLWSATQAHYRPSAGYVVSVVLIEARKGSGAALPVLSRGLVVEPSLLVPYPTIERVVPPSSEPAAVLGATIDIEGHHLDGTVAAVSFAHRLLPTPNVVNVGTISDPQGFTVVLPAGALAEAAWPAGLYSVSVSVVRPGETEARQSPVVGLLLAPEPTLPPTTLSRNAATRAVTVTIGCRPRIQPAQDARLALGGAVAASLAHPNPTSVLTFVFGDIAAGPQRVRLTVDGVESPVLDRSTTPPTFRATQSVLVPV